MVDFDSEIVLLLESMLSWRSLFDLHNIFIIEIIRNPQQSVHLELDLNQSH